MPFFLPFNYDKMKPSFPILLTYLACFAALLIAYVGCGTRYDGTYYADVYIQSLGDGGKSSDTAMTSIYITCRESHIGKSEICNVSRIDVEDGSSLNVDILLWSGPFVNEEGAINNRFLCGPYPGKENIQICVRPFEKVK